MIRGWMRRALGAALDEPLERCRDSFAHDLGREQPLRLGARQRPLISVGSLRACRASRRSQRPCPRRPPARPPPRPTRSTCSIAPTSVVATTGTPAASASATVSANASYLLACSRMSLRARARPAPRAPCDVSDVLRVLRRQLLEQLRVIRPHARAADDAKAARRRRARAAAWRARRRPRRPLPVAIRPSTVTVGGVPSGRSLLSKRSSRTGFGTTADRASAKAVVAHQVFPKHVADAHHQRRAANLPALDARPRPQHRRGQHERVRGPALKAEPALPDQKAQRVGAALPGWATSGTVRLSRRGIDEVFDVRELVENVIGVVPVPAQHLRAQTQRGEAARGERADERRHPRAAVPPVPSPAHSSPTRT